MKSLVSRMHLVVESLLTDFSRAYPSLSGEFDRDKRSLASYASERGIGFFTLDLPNFGSILLDGLESGSLTLSGPVSRRVSKRVKVPALLRGLWLLVFTRSGSLRLDPDPTAIAFIRQFSDCCKKVELSCTPARNKAAIQEFVDVERTARPPTLRWTDDELFDGSDTRGLSFSSYGRLCQHASDSTEPALFEDDLGRLSEADTHLLERLDSICRDVSTGLGLFDAVEYDTLRRSAGRPSGTKNGPGAVSDLDRKKEKFFFRNWPEKLQSVFPIDFFGHRPDEQGDHFLNLEHNSKLLMVPKTAKTPRLIASEPSYHQWCQQLVKVYLEDGIKTLFGRDIITFDDQSKSYPLVELGSQDRSYCTVDLSAASDRLTCWTVERVFAKNLSLLNAFHACRTRVIGPSEGVDIDHTFLRKFSTMGSALTFPVQSLVFACVALAVLPGKPRLDSQLRRWRKQVRVYGDDIIIPSTGYADLVRLLTILGLKVNANKSFVRGHFRESCGFDAFQGHDVTPVKPRSLDPTKPDGRVSLIELTNNLFLKGYWTASEAARSLLPKETAQSLPVVGHRSGATGLTSYVGSDVSANRRRYNDRLQRIEVLCTTYISRAETTESVGTDYTLQLLHAATFRKECLPVAALPSKGVKGRVVKAVTRERRSWVVIDDLTVLAANCSHPVRGCHSRVIPYLVAEGSANP
jgi:hypothetical protein